MLFKEGTENAINGKQKDNVRKDKSAVSDTMEINRKNRLQNQLDPPFHQHKRGRSVWRKRTLRGKSPSGKTNRQPCRDFLTGTKLPCDCWHLPECQFFQSESGRKFGKNCAFPHCKLDGQQNKKAEKGSSQKCSGNNEKCTTIGLHTTVR